MESVKSILEWFLSEMSFFVVSLTLLVVARSLFGFAYRGCCIKEELVDKDNPAMAIVFSGYVLGMTIAIGGSLIGPNLSLKTAIYDLIIYGTLAILFMFVSHFVGMRIVLRKFDAKKEILIDQNAGVASVLAANHIAMGFVVYGAVAGEGTIITATVFWLLGQIAIIGASLFYSWILPFDLHQEIEKNNVPVGVAFSGVLFATGNIVRCAIQGNFVSWTRDLLFFAVVMGSGIILLPLSRFIVERVILSGRTLMEELVRQEHPNIGAGIIEASIYVAISFLIGWSIGS